MAVQISGNDITVPRDGSFTRNVTIGGTLTYEDVTNIDSVGLVTARTGIEIGARPGVAASISIDGNMIVSGISTFGGDVQVPDKIIHSGDTNTAIRFPSADTITFETAGSERLRISSNGNLGIGAAPTAGFKLSITDAGNPTVRIEDTDASNSIFDLGQNNGEAQLIARGPSSANGTFVFYQHDGSTLSIAAKIDTAGRLMLGTTTEGYSSADDLTVSTSGATGITIRSGTSNTGTLAFSDGTSGADEYRGYAQYQHQNNALAFGVNASEALRIESNTRVLVGHTDNIIVGGHLARLQISGTDYNQSTVSIMANSNDANGAYLMLGHQRSGSAGGTTILNNNDEVGVIRFAACDGSDLAHPTAEIKSHVDGTPGANDMPGRLAFFTTADGGTSKLERMRINANGLVSLGDAISGMDMGFGNQMFNSKSGTYSAQCIGSTSASVTTSIIYNSNTSFGGAVSMCDWRAAASNSSAWYFLRLSSSSASDNEFFLAGDGNGYADGNWNSGGAAYAEYFEWSDGNTSDEDRRGMTVVLDGTKIKIATSSDSTDNIIGVVSGNPAMVADTAYCKWSGKYQRDDYNAYVRDSEGHRVLNSDYDDTKTYLPRKERKEWDAIGIVGKLRVRKGQQTGTRWIKMRDVSDAVEEWLVR